ncbi:hypothetical protein, partial [Tenuifilum osseticum]|uniref:hypothetical protein n=1 Tax=Tenuifilum osseticum TaxID=3374723 RepID=UPI0034E53AC8
LSSATPRALPSESGCKSRKAFLITQEDFKKNKIFFKKKLHIIDYQCQFLQENYEGVVKSTQVHWILKYVSE